ncbi:hypothetical protein PLESTB_001062600 [Pleodorina starrii]|uniref:O-fucosyltransferase family protein n=1 Tax=Pleodorina starrii TaxID=330485 RepID=A0A9W6F4D5_9CHLO|nr:hypothetical protein PLESTM_001280500 [Pleodorina starrii]GLC56083.1 hypothetical protein PLESTB_001062600 [Pleodorina starrii]GLC64067.1 hypothetical protein PLESTF_000114700 [Pleodorina starrii]
MYILSRLLKARRRRLLPNGPLVIACFVLICASVWIYPTLGPISANYVTPDEAAASGVDQSVLRLKTKTRGVLELHDNNSTKFLMVQCHRGQFSNRLGCLKHGILLSRALHRVLVMPMFTDVVPTVDVSKYVSLECLRRNSLAVTFEQFREHICHGVGLEAPQPVTIGVAQPDADNATTPTVTGAFCEDNALLQLNTGYSLADYRGYNCWNRREDVTNARDLGIQVSGCTHVAPGGLSADPERGSSYSLADIRRHFASRSEKVLLFLDLFGVNIMPSTEDVADTVSDPGQMCSWMPTEAAAAAADTVMQILVPPPQPLQLSIPADGIHAAAAAASGTGGDAVAVGLSVVLDPTTHRTLFMGPSELAREPPPVRLRGARRYAAVHLRRSDWFYYCGGSSSCFYSIAEAGSWLNDTLAAQGLDTLYISTNADAREKEMLRRAVAGRVLYWEDALLQLRSWQVEGVVAAVQEGGEVADDADAAEGGALPAWLKSLPLDDELMVQMVEKAICMQATFFIASIGSTFSDQIRDFRNGGLQDLEWGIIERKFPAAVASGPPESATTPNGGGGGGEVPGKVVPLREQPKFLCDDTRPPRYADERRLPDYHNPKVFWEEVKPFVAPVRDAALRLWRKITKKGAVPAAPSPVSAGPPLPPRRRPTLLQILTAPARALEWLCLVVQDGHAMAAANRFVDMYTGGAMVALVVESNLTVPPAALADCVVAAAAEAGAVSLHVSMIGLPEEQQVLLMQELEARTALQQITRMGGADQERGNTFTLLWRGDGLSRHAEPALLEELPTFLERVDGYVLAKARVVLGDRRGTLFRQVANTRRVFGFLDPRDGRCSPAELLGNA